MTHAQEHKILDIAIKGASLYRRRDLYSIFELLRKRHYSVSGAMVLLNEAATYATRARAAIKILDGETTQ